VENPVFHPQNGSVWVAVAVADEDGGHRDDEEQSCKDEDREFRPVVEMGWRPGMSREAYERLLRLIFGPID